MAPDAAPQVLVPHHEQPSYTLVFDDLGLGDGDEARDGSAVEVHYVGQAWSDGVKSDASWDRAHTFPLPLGAGHTIAGWHQGVAGGVIGPDETLELVVDLVAVR